MFTIEGNLNSEELSGLVPIEEREYYDMSLKQNESLYNRIRNTTAVPDNMGNYFELYKIDIPAFKKSIAHLVRRHEILRTTFIRVDGVMKQRVNNFDAFPFEMEEIDLLDDTNQREKFISIYKDAMHFLFDYEAGPLIKAILCRIAEDRYLFIFVIDHAICDGWSFQILMDDQAELYKKYLKDEYVEEIPRIQFKDFSAWQLKIFFKSKKSANTKYWRAKMQRSNFKVNYANFYSHYQGKFPGNETRNASRLDSNLEQILSIRNGKQYCVAKDDRFKQKLIQSAIRCNSTLFCLLMASVNILLFKVNRQKETLTAIPFANRYGSGLEDLVGNMMGTIYIHSLMEENMTLLQNIEAAKFEILESIDHIIDDHGELNLPFNFITSTSIFINFVDLTIAGPERSNTKAGVHTEINPFFALECYIFESSTGLTFKWNYNRDLFTSPMIEYLVSQHLVILDLMIGNNFNQRIGNI